MKKLLVLLLLLGAVLVGGTYWLSLPRTQVVGEDGFRYELLEWGDIAESVSSTGVLTPLETVVVGTELAGKVVHLFPNASLNQVVEEDEPLLQLDDTMPRQALLEAQTGVAAAEAAVMAARSTLTQAEVGFQAVKLKENRLADAVRNQTGLNRQHDEALIELKQAEHGIKAAQAGIAAALARLESARAAEAKAQTGVRLTTVRVPTNRDPKSPSTGSKRKYTIIDRQVTLGQLVGPQMPVPLFTLATDLGQMQVYAQVAEGDITKIQLRQQASFTIYGYADSRRFLAEVKEIRPKSNNLQGAVFFTVELDVTNTREEEKGRWSLLPGMTANVDISLRKHADVWKVPTKALSFQLEKEFFADGAVRKMEEWKGRRDADDWKQVWMLDANRKGMPYYVRIGGTGREGRAGLKDGQFNEVHEFDPDLKPAPDPKNKETWFKFLVDAPPAQKGGLFSKQIKVF